MTLKLVRYPLFLGLFFISLFTRAQTNLQLIGHLPYGTATLAGCWHYVDSTGIEYALLGTSKGFSIVDVSNPAQPFERFFVPGIMNLWREMTTSKGFAYVGSEADSSGVTIVDLRSLPDTIYSKVWSGDGAFTGMVRRSHTIKSANGYLYIFGGGNVTSGATIADLTDPWNPHIVGKYTNFYVHDGDIKGDTLWTSEVGNSQFSIVDVTDKSNPHLILTNPTPFPANHNTDFSPDGKILFTTHESNGQPLGVFDVSDIENIHLLDTYYPSQSPTNEVHNVRVINDFLVNPSYGGQLTIVDASRPDNLVETGFTSLGSSLVWDADPYLPSGIIIATGLAEGLFIYQPTYQHAAFLEGKITDITNGNPLSNASVQIVGAPKQELSAPNGLYKTGIGPAGTYTVEVSKADYFPKTITNVQLQNGQVTELNVALVPEVTGSHEAPGTPGFSVNPTLFTDAFVVDIPTGSVFASEGSMVQLLDLQGHIVLQASVKGSLQQVSVPSFLPAGTYLVRLGNYRKWSKGVKVVKQ